MGRKKIEIKYVKDQAHRNAFFQKRVRGAFKKASELFGLCGARICVSVEDTDHRRLYVYNTHVDHEVNSDQLQYASSNGLQINVYQPTEKLFKKIINDQHNESYRQNLQQLPTSNSMGCQQQQKLKQKQQQHYSIPSSSTGGIHQQQQLCSIPSSSMGCMQQICTSTPPPMAPPPMAGIQEPSTPTNMQMECSFTPPPMAGIQEPSTPTNMQMEDCDLLLEKLHDLEAAWEEMFDQYEEPDQHNIFTPSSILQQQQHEISRQQQQEQILTPPSLGQQHQYGSPREQQQESPRQQNHQASLGQQHRQDEFPQQHRQDEYPLQKQHDDQNAATSHASGGGGGVEDEDEEPWEEIIERWCGE